jgi:hypothetical protein
MQDIRLSFANFTLAAFQAYGYNKDISGGRLFDVL